MGFDKSLLISIFYAAKRRDPCFICSKSHSVHHGTIDARNLCYDCWEKEGKPSVQIFPGDEGLSISECVKCYGSGVLIRWICGYLESFPSLSCLCPVHGGCLQNTVGQHMEMIRCDCTKGLKTDISRFQCYSCKKFTCSDHYRLESGISGKMCFACNYFDPNNNEKQEEEIAKIETWRDRPSLF